MCVRWWWWWWGDLEVKSGVGWEGGGSITEFICLCQREPERGFVCELLKEGEREGEFGRVEREIHSWAYQNSSAERA